MEVCRACKLGVLHGSGAWLSGRASPSHGGGQWFESISAHHQTPKVLLVSRPDPPSTNWVPALVAIGRDALQLLSRPFVVCSSTTRPACLIRSDTVATCGVSSERTGSRWRHLGESQTQAGTDRPSNRHRSQNSDREPHRGHGRTSPFRAVTAAPDQGGGHVRGNRGAWTGRILAWLRSCDEQIVGWTRFTSVLALRVHVREALQKRLAGRLGPRGHEPHGRRSFPQSHHWSRKASISS